MTVAKVIATQSPVNVVDIVGEIVDNIRAEYDPDNLEKPYYLHGHPLEIINTLKERANSGTELKLKKFPLIALFEDILDDGKSGVFEKRTKLNIVFITNTNKDYKAAQRYANSFDAILTPIYDLFLKYAKRQRKVHVDHNSLSAKPVYHLYWGKKGLYGNEGNVFDDFIDAIEVKDLDLKIYR